MIKTVLVLHQCFENLDVNKRVLVLGLVFETLILESCVSYVSGV